MEIITKVAQQFMQVFEAGGKVFMDWIMYLIPVIICLMTAINCITKLIGEERVERITKKATNNVITRYTIVPVLAILFLGNPMCYSFGRFLEERYKPAYYDSCVSFLHPVTGLFPHANGAELFVFMGIAAGLAQQNLSTTPLAVRYLITGVIVIFMRGIITERIYIRMLSRTKRKNYGEV